MPQIGQLRKGLWVTSGFGRQGLNTTAMAGQLIARSILWGDERWRLFSPFELVWAGGATGRVAGYLSGCGGAEVPPPPARWPATANGRGRRSVIREARLAEANRQAGTGDRRRAGQPPGRRAPASPATSQHGPQRDRLQARGHLTACVMASPGRRYSQQSEKYRSGSV